MLEELMGQEFQKSIGLQLTNSKEKTKQNKTKTQAWPTKKALVIKGMEIFVCIGEGVGVGRGSTWWDGGEV